MGFLSTCHGRCIHWHLFSCATLAGCLIVVTFALAAPPTDALVQVRRNFGEDPGWDHYQNRIVGVDMPMVIEDFGWSDTSYVNAGKGEIGGRVDNSRYQAYYAIPLGKPLSFDDEISASGKVALRHLGLRGVGYFGFFNSKRHTWRVWSSMAFRIWEEDMLGQIMFDWMSSDWQARGAETAILLAPDGQPHSWSFRYEPNVRSDPTWHDKSLERHITDQTGNGRAYELQGEEFIFARLKKEEPKLTPAALHKRLLQARDQGLIEYFHRHDQHRWWKREDGGHSHGRVTLQFDNQTPNVFWFDEKIRRAPVEFDRFGLFNIKRFGEWVEVYFGDLTVNGQEIELSQDPHWDARNNRAEYVEPNFHGMHDYGWSQTNWAGAQPGEIGGLFWRTEPEDPLFSYYADDVGELTLDDPLEFSGSIYFDTGMTDAAAYFGYFNHQDQTTEFSKGDADAGRQLANMLGITISDSSAVGYYFAPMASAQNTDTVRAQGPVFTPGHRRRHFSFRYDPTANKGVGRVEITLDDHKFGMDLTEAYRRSGAVFNRFGLANIRGGGHSVEFYLDDLSYTARRSAGVKPKFVKQTYVEVPYPHEQGGRRY